MTRCLTLGWLFAAALFSLSGCTIGPVEQFTLRYEVRVPHGVEFPRDPRGKDNEVDFARGMKGHDYVVSGGTYAHALKRRVDGRFTVYGGDDLINRLDWGRFIIVNSEVAPTQVFELRIPREPQPMDWSEWQRPDFLTSGRDAWWNVVRNKALEKRSYAIPKNCLMVRYSIETEDQKRARWAR